MRLTVAGCSPAWPNPGGAHSGYLVESDAGSTLLDCGPGVLARLRADQVWPELDSIVITHFHLDHWGDLIPWVWGSLYLGLDTGQPELWVQPGGRAQLEQFGSLLGFPDMFERVFGLREYVPGVPFVAGGHTVVAVKVPHYRIEAHALRVSSAERVLGYSADSGPSENLAVVARDADLFVCEATLLSNDLDGQPRGHLTIDEALEAYAASGARRLLVTHRPAELETPAGLELAHDGLVVEL